MQTYSNIFKHIQTSPWTWDFFDFTDRIPREKPQWDQAGAALGAVAFFTSTARCFDVLSDPLMAQAWEKSTVGSSP